MHLHLMQVHYAFAAMTPDEQLDEASLDAWRAFLTAHALITRRISRDLVAEGLPDLGWYDLLWALRRSPGRRLRVNELAREVVLSPTAMSRFVDRAVAAGVVAREPDPDDRRGRRVGRGRDDPRRARHQGRRQRAGLRALQGADPGPGAPALRPLRRAGVRGRVGVAAAGSRAGARGDDA